MNLFRLFYEGSGAGIEKDAEPKTGLALFLDIVRRDGWDVFKMAAVCLLASVPIVTIPAALSGFHAATMRIIQDTPGDYWYDFCKGWKNNWKKAYPLTLFFAVVVALLRFAASYYSAQQGLFAGLSLVCTGLLILLSMAAVYVFPMLLTVELGTADILKNAVLLALARPHHAGASVAAGVILMTLTGFLSPVLWPLCAALTLMIVGIVADWFAWMDIKELIIH